MSDRSVQEPRRLTYGFVAPYIWGDLSLNYLKGTVKGAETHDINLICVIGQTPKDPENHNASANIAYELINKRLRDGLIIWASHIGQYLTEEELDQFYKKFEGIPIVSLGEVIGDYPAVAMDNHDGIVKLIDHLVEVHGYQKIGFIRGPEYHEASEERYAGYLAGIKKHNLPFEPRLVSQPRLISEGNGVKALADFLDDLQLKPKDDIEALVCVSDGVALGAIKELMRRGIKVPDQIGVVGFNNKNESRMTNPSITTIDPQLPFYGQIAVELLREVKKGKRISGKHYVESKLVIRGSCGCRSHIYDYQPRNSKQGGFISKADLERIISKIEIIATDFIRLPNTQWVSKLVECFFINIKDPTSSIFINYLNELLEELKYIDADSVGNFNMLITEMRYQVLPYLATAELMNRGCELWDQARLLVTQTIEFLDADYKTKIDGLLISLYTTNQTLMTSYDLDELKSVIEELLKKLRIPSCYLSLYEDPENPLEAARLVFAVTDNQRINLDNMDTRFVPADLVPDGILPTDRRYTMILHPLYYKDSQLGFALFETGPLDKAIYQILCSEISNALHRVMIFQELKESEKERTKLLKSLSEKNIELEQKIQERTADIQKVNQQLRIAIEQANAANVAKTRFLANISHEIRTPLNSIIGFAEVLSSTIDAEQHDNYVSLIIKESEKLVELINQILDLSKIEANKFSLTLEPFDIYDLLESLTSVYSATAQKKGLDYYCKIDDKIPARLIGDPLRLRQVLVNLIGNAIKFTAKGQVKVTTELANETWDKVTLLFKIIDTGIGIPKDRQKSIFDVFVQAEDSITRRYGGTGLGVSISKQLVQLMGGEIGLESEVDQGSTFWFTAVFEKAAPEEQIKEIAVNYDEFNIPESIQDCHILLVEDYPINRTLVKSHLRTLGCKISVAENGQKAVEMFKTGKYDLILMDVQMPKMDGCEATKIIRSLPFGLDVPIIGLTANAFEYDIAHYMHVGMNDVLTKPFRKHQLLNKVYHWLTNNTLELPTDEDNNTMDLAYLLEEFNYDTEFVLNLIDEFIKSAKDHIQVLEAAIMAQDSTRLVENAHRIKGAALNLSANDFAEVAAILEEQGKKNDITNAKVTLGLLIQQLDKFERFVEAKAKTLTLKLAEGGEEANESTRRR